MEENPHHVRKSSAIMQLTFLPENPAYPFREETLDKNGNIMRNLDSKAWSCI
jgi:hypothetical protein